MDYTLSPHPGPLPRGEGERSSGSWKISNAVLAARTWSSTKLWKLFPLPEGEGKGEGKAFFRMSRNVVDQDDSRVFHHAMSSLPEPIASLIAALNRLPGIGPRSAERIALHLVQAEGESVRQLAQAILRARERIQTCSSCGALTEIQPCALCADPRRDGTVVCLVEQPVDIISIEKSGTFHGKYHVLGGKISPLNGVEPEDLRITELEARLGKEGIKEIIIALGTDVEGDATSFYLARRLTDKGATISRIAHGLPAGSGLEFADELTLSHALEGRREIK